MTDLPNPPPGASEISQQLKVRTGMTWLRTGPNFVAKDLSVARVEEFLQVAHDAGLRLKHTHADARNSVPDLPTNNLVIPVKGEKKYLKSTGAKKNYTVHEDRRGYDLNIMQVHECSGNYSLHMDPASAAAVLEKFPVTGIRVREFDGRADTAHQTANIALGKFTGIGWNADSKDPDCAVAGPINGKEAKRVKQLVDGYLGRECVKDEPVVLRTLPRQPGESEGTKHVAPDDKYRLRIAYADAQKIATEKPAPPKPGLGSFFHR